MKPSILFLLGLFYSVLVFTQNSFNYQAIIRDTEGEVMANEQVNLTVNLLQGSATGTVVYSEVHDSTTNDFGLVNLHIGAGDPAGFDTIDWRQGPYFINIKLVGNSISTSRLQSVPYAMYAQSSQESKLLKERLALVENMLMDNDLYTVEDYDGNKYKTVRLGRQVWMKENLRTTHYADGTPLVDGTDSGDIGHDFTTQYYFWYDDSAAYAETYGALYTWAAAMRGDTSSNTNPSNVQGVCPNGWHLPSDKEWQQLLIYLGMDKTETENWEWIGTDEGGKLKDTTTTHWKSPNTGATNETGFTAAPSGFRYRFGPYAFLFEDALIWASTEDDAVQGIYYGLRYNTATVRKSIQNKYNALSVRCVRDEF
jgi:uncharacterized protein (TIGR02145 family)